MATHRGEFIVVVGVVADVEGKGFVRRKLYLHPPNAGSLPTAADVDPTFALRLTPQCQGIHRSQGQRQRTCSSDCEGDAFFQTQLLNGILFSAIHLSLRTSDDETYLFW